MWNLCYLQIWQIIFRCKTFYILQSQVSRIQDLHISIISEYSLLLVHILQKPIFCFLYETSLGLLVTELLSN